MKFLTCCIILLLASCSQKQEKETHKVTPKAPVTIDIDERGILSDSKPTISKKTNHEGSSTDNEPSLDMVTVEGTRPLRQVETEIKRHLITSNYWYNKAYPTTTETIVITVAFTISPLGVPKDVQLKRATFKDDSFVQKIVDDITNWRFARYDENHGDTKVIYPITLRPAKCMKL